MLGREDSVLEKTFRKCGKKSCFCSSAGLGKSRGLVFKETVVQRPRYNQHRACAGPHCQQVYGEEWDCAYAVGTPSPLPT